MRFFAPLLVLPFVLLGCSKNEVAGKWSLEPKAGMPAGAVTVEFKPDSSYLMHLDLGTGGGGVTIDVTGTYKVEGKKLSTTSSDVKIDTSKLPPALKAMEAQMKEQVKKEIGKAQSGDFEVKEDKLTWKTEGGDTVLTRVKA